jgi:hypothetical protein
VEALDAIGGDEVYPMFAELVRKVDRSLAES